MTIEYLHVEYSPETGWVLQIMSRLLKSTDPQLREAFDKWSDTPLKELGLAISTRIQYVGKRSPKTKSACGCIEG